MFPIWALPLALLTLVYKVVGRLIYNHARRTTTALDDIPALGQSRPSGKKIGGTAIVAGGSVAGLFAARVLSEHFENVTVIEPDTELNHKRSRVGQWNQGHVFLPTALLICRRLFPGFDDEARKSGLLLRPYNYNMQLEGKTLRHDSSVFPPALASTRMGFERLLRRLVHERCKNVTFIQGSVTGVSASSNGRYITSVQVRTESDGEQSMSAAFFADCTGPASTAMKWLPRANPAWETPKKDTYDPRVGYSTGIYKLTPEELARIDAVLPESLRGLPYIRHLYGSTKSGSHLGYGVGRGDDNTLFLGAIQWGHVVPYPTTLDEFATYMAESEKVTTEEGDASAPAYHAVRVLQEILGKEGSAAPTLFKHAVNGGMHHIRYDLLPRSALPANFCAIGDALVRLNPVFGQGCTKAAQDATTLDAILRACSGSQVPDDFAKKMLDLQTPRSRVFFDNNRTMDYGYSTTIPMKGETLAKGAFLRKYSEAVVRLAHSSVEAGTLFGKSLVMLEPNVLMLEPTFAFRVLWNAFMSPQIR